MRSPADPEKIRRFLRALGERVKGPGRIYLVGGSSALLVGWRSATIDIDLKIDPEPPGVFEAIAQLKNELDVNVELAAPDDFLPPLAGWRERSTFIDRHGPVDFFHYDFRSQALSKLARGLDRDLADAEAMLERGLVTRGDLLAGLEELLPQLVRYPTLDSEALEGRVRTFLESEDRPS